MLIYWKYTISRNTSPCSFSVLAFDQEQLQFVADIRAPSRDPGSIYILSSRFHRFFLKNLNANEINTRIMRLDGVTRESVPTLNNAITPQPSFGQVKHPGFNGIISRTAPPSYPSISPQPHAYDPFYASVRSPYRFEQVGVINKGVQNPFAALNAGERPDAYKFSNSLRHAKFSGTPASGLGFGGLYQKPSGFHDFNGLRVAKSADRNATAFTWERTNYIYDRIEHSGNEFSKKKIVNSNILVIEKNPNLENLRFEWFADFHIWPINNSTP